MLILISIIPLVNVKKILKLKFYPVLLSIIFCSIYLKQNYQLNKTGYNVTAGNSSAQIKLENERQVLRLDVKDGNDTEIIISGIRIKNPDIKIIELADNCSTNLSASKKIMNDYVIEEYRFAGIPDLNNIFKKIIFQLENENVIVKFDRGNLLSNFNKR